MANINLNDLSKAPWYMRLVLWYQEKKYGSMLEPVQAWAKSPLVFRKFYRLWQSFNRRSSPLPAELRTLVTLYVSRRNECAFCMDIHAAKLLAQTTCQKKVDELLAFETSTAFNQTEKVALKYAEMMSAVPVSPIPETVTALQIEFNDFEIVELTALIAFQHMSSKFNAALDLKAYGFCQINEKQHN